MTENMRPLVVTLCGLFVLSVSATPREIRTVMVVDNEICIKYGDGPITQLTEDGFAKAIPTWSKDGAQIAFIEGVKDQGAMAKLVIIDMNHNAISEMSIHPYLPGEVESGMRSVEALEWLTADRLVVSGTVNPSTTEYDVIDLTRRVVTKQVFNDGQGAAFSPDGQHYAYTS
jgi:hypothetical protein